MPTVINQMKNWHIVKLAVRAKHIMIAALSDFKLHFFVQNRPELPMTNQRQARKSNNNSVPENCYTDHIQSRIMFLDIPVSPLSFQLMHLSSCADVSTGSVPVSSY